MTSLRQRMLEDMSIRNLADNTQLSYLQQVSSYARHFKRSPERLGPEEVRAYNSNLVTANPPTGYADLLRPEYKGRLGTSELAATTLIAWYDWLEKTQGKDYLPKLRGQNPKMYNGTVPLAQSLAAGEIAVGAFGNITSFKPLIEQGAPIKLVIPSPGLGYEYDMAGLGWSKRPNATLLFMDYVMSREGQTVWNGTGEGASPRSDVPGSLPIATITAWDASAYSPDAVAKYRAYWNGIFK